MRELGEALEPRSVKRRVRRFAARAALGAAFLFVYGLLAVAEARGENARAELSAAVENGHGRLIFSFSEHVKAGVQVSNGILIVTFARPVAVSTEQAERRLGGYVQAVRRDPDGTALRMSLSRKVTVNVMEAGERLFVDLLPDSWSGLPPGLPQSVIDDLAKRARDAERLASVRRIAQVQDTDPAVVRLRVSSAPTFARFAFELPGPIGVASEREGQELRLHFNSPVRVDLGAARAQLPRGVVGLDVAFEERRSTVKLVLAPNADAREFREDRAVLVDVAPGPMGGATPAVIRSLAEETEAQAERDRATIEAAALAEAAESEKAALRDRPPLAEVEGDDVPPAPLDFTTSPGGIANSNLVPVMGRHGGNFSIDFAFADPVTAAVFTRGDNIWILFDTPRAIDVSGFIDEPSRTVHQAQYVRSDLGAAVRLKLSRARLPSIERDGNTWRLTLADSVTSPSRPLPLRRSPGVDERGAVIVPLESPGQVHRLRDPEVGDTVIVVTAPLPARGVLRGQNFVEFRALASIHGLAFVPLADDLAVTLTVEGAHLQRPGGLAVSNLPAPPPPPKQAAAPRKATALDPDGWKAEQAADFAEREGVLIYSVSSSPPGQRADARLMLARFYLAHRFSAEAIGVLEAGVREDNQLINRPLHFLLRGLAELELGRPTGALELLKNPKLAGVPEAALLRAVANADLGRWTRARDVLRIGADAIPDLPVELQRRVLFAAARSAIEVRDLNEATRYMQDLEVMTVPPEHEPEFVLLAGRVAEGIGRFERAKALYDAVAELEIGPPAAEARLRSVAMRQGRGELDRGKAIERLETLAMVWRGDHIELDTIRLLGRLYVAEARYRDAFKLLDAALIVDAEAESTHEFHVEMGSVFEDLYLTGKSESLPSIEALALYYDFSRLTPIGRRGDELIRRLADRLVAVDLLEQAAELLDHQVNYRLTGAAKAQVAAKLAVVHLMNRKPVEAVRVISGTRMPQLPQELREQRLFVEARALSETGRHDTALELMENLRGPEADRLRADVYWAAKDWREAGERLEKLVGERWKNDGALEPADRHDVLRAALAYTLGAEAIGLSRVKEKFAEKMGDTTEGKVLQMLVSNESANPRTLTEAARALSSFDSLGTFIKRYRERYPDQPLPPDPTPTSSLFKTQRVSGR